MRFSPQSSRRPGFTLIELIVVMSLITILAAMLYFTFPKLSGSNAVSSAADRISGWLLIAKQRAKRDGRPTGVRISPDALGRYSVFQYIQQPDDFAVSSIHQLQTLNGVATVSFTPLPPIAPSKRFTPLFATTGSDDTVLPGDYLEIYGGGPVRKIQSIIPGVQSVNPFPPKVPNALSFVTLATTSTALPAVTFNTTAVNYRIIRQPRLLSGEADLVLPDNIGVDFSTVTIGGVSTTLSNLQPSTAVAGAYDILFTPSGAVTGQGSSTGQLYLWVRDLTADNSTNIQNGFPIIVAVQMSTGFISSQPVGDPSDPFAFTRDGRGSGL